MNICLGSNCFYLEFENTVSFFFYHPMLHQESQRLKWVLNICKKKYFLSGSIENPTSDVPMHRLLLFVPLLCLWDQSGFNNLLIYSTIDVDFAIWYVYWFLNFFKHRLFSRTISLSYSWIFLSVVFLIYMVISSWISLFTVVL